MGLNLFHIYKYYISNKDIDGWLKMEKKLLFIEKLHSPQGSDDSHWKIRFKWEEFCIFIDTFTEEAISVHNYTDSLQKRLSSHRKG